MLIRMRTLDTAKKAGLHADWHPADVVAALHKRGWSLRRLAAAHGYATIHPALRVRWQQAERIIADAIGVHPRAIWPSRYDTRGRPLHGRGTASSDRSAGHGIRNINEPTAV